LLWWDADDLRELSDGTRIEKADGTRLFSCDDCMSNNHTKATPSLTADLFGDYREEVVWRTPDSSALRIYTTTHVSRRRLYTLMHDPQYRMQITAEQTGYNQPPQPGFFLGDGMAAAPEPDIHVR
jgi:rhamnogalacturonan endolyase